MARFPVVMALVAAVGSIGSFIAQEETQSARWELVDVGRVSGVILGLALVGALVVSRRPSAIAGWGQVAVVAASVAFVIVAITKLYEPSFPEISFAAAVPWAAEANVLALAALVLGLTGLRTAGLAVRGGLASAIGMAVGCAGYAIALRGDTSAYAWWEFATVATFLAASGAARLTRR